MFEMDFIVMWLVLSLAAERMTGYALEGKCEEGHFHCSNFSDVCVPQINICDLISDCPDGSDELNCDDLHGSNYYDNLFRKRPAAEHDDYELFCVLPYNGTCKCRFRDLSCQHLSLENAPDDLPHVEIDILDLTGNPFHLLSPRTLRNIPDLLETLVLQHCEVKEIFAKTFYSLTTLKKLHMDNNLLREIPAAVFPQNNSLEILTLGYNAITDINAEAFKVLTVLIELDLSNNKISSVDENVLRPLENLTILNLRGNLLRILDVMIFPQLPLLTLSLGENHIEYVESRTFLQLPTLRNLFLSGNKIRRLGNESFYGLSRLLALTLDNNLLEEIEFSTFKHTPNLTSLDFRHNKFKKLDKNVLKPLTELGHIYFDKFEMCVAAPHVRVCEPKGDGISSQEHLLDNIVLRASVWIMAAIGCIGNMIVLLGRFFAGKTNNVVHSLYIKNLALSDLLMGIYLFTIAGVDHYYRGEYIFHQYRWRHSILCNLCGFLNTLSCESSVLILSLVTWDRFVSVTQPLARKQPSPKTAAMTLLFLWTVAAVVAVAPLITLTESYFGREFYSSNGVCLPLYIHNPFASGWEYSAIMFVLINAAALTFICYAYSRMIHEIRVSGVACRSTQQSQERDKVAQRFGIIVFTDCLCWVPVIIVKLAAISGLHFSEKYRNFIYASLAIYVMPINSALNPVLYTLTTTLFKKQMRRFLGTCLHKKRTDPQNSGYDSAFSLSLGMFPKGGSMRRVLTYRGTQSSLTGSKNSWKRPSAPTPV